MPTGDPEEYQRAHRAFAEAAKESGHKIQYNPPLGSGARFAALKNTLAKRPGIKDPGALAASIGRKKYGNARFQALAAKGRRR